MNKGKIFVIGGGKLQVDFISTIKNNGYEAIVFDYNQKCEGAKIADKFYCISIDDKEKILEIAKKEKPVAIHTVATEAGNITSCYVGEKLGLKTNSYKTALNTVDKDLMKRVFKEHDIPNAEVIRLYSNADLEKINLSLPFVIKASDRSAGRGVSLVSSYDELNDAYEDAYKQSNNKIVLAEEYLMGNQYSVELVSQDGEHHILGITREYFVDEKDFVESHYLLPDMDETNIIELYGDLFKETLDAFEIRYGASHIEFRINKNEIKIIEIASRMGGRRDTLLRISKGFNFNQLILDSITGNPIMLRIKDVLFGMGKLVYTEKDINTYQKIKDKFVDIDISNLTKRVELTQEKPKTMIDAIDNYFLTIQEIQIVDNIINMWEKDNSDIR